MPDEHVSPIAPAATQRLLDSSNVCRSRCAWLLLSLVAAAGGCVSEGSATLVDGALTRAMPEPPGESCASGGLRVQTGPDVDADHVLDDDEIESVEYVCAPPIPTLVREDAVAAGASCPSAGVAARTGRDLDRDGVLDDAEIEHTVNVCDPTQLWAGDLRTSQWASPEARTSLAHVRVITGTLVIDDGAALPLLELVARDVQLTAEVPSIELPALARVVGGLTVSSSVLAGVSLPQLAAVGSRVVLDWTATDAVVSAPALASIGADFKLAVGQEADVRMPALREIGGALVLDGKPTALALPSLASIRGALKIYLEASTVRLATLTSIGSSLSISTFHVATVELPSLRQIDGDLRVRHAPALTTLALPAAVAITGQLSINAPALKTRLARIAGDLAIRNNSELSSLQALRTLQVEDNARLPQSEIADLATRLGK